MAVDDATIILEAAMEANASESLVRPFRRALAQTSKAATGLAADAAAGITSVWDAAVTAHVEPELNRQAGVMLQVAAEANGLDASTVALEDLTSLVTEFVDGVRRYSQLLEGRLFKAAEKDPDALASQALANALGPDRAELLADGLTVHFRNGVTWLVLSVALPPPDQLTASGRMEFQGVLTTPPPEADPFNRVKMWVSMRDGKVRRSHVTADGQIVRVAEVFLIPPSNDPDAASTAPARFPGDPRLPVAVRINCRCFLVRGDPLAAPPPGGGADNTDESSVAAAELIGEQIARRRAKAAAVRRARRAREAAQDAARAADDAAGGVADDVVDAAGDAAGAAADAAGVSGLSPDALLVDAAAAEAAAVEAIASIEDALLDAVPEARKALQGGAAQGLLASILGASDPEVPLIVAALLALLLEGDDADGDGIPDNRFSSVERFNKPVQDAQRRLHWRSVIGRHREAMMRRLSFADAGPNYSDGVMICVRPTDEQAAALAIFEPDGLPASEMHVTLGYFGSTTDDPAPSQDQLGEVLGEVLSEWNQGAIEGEVTAVTVFEGNDSRPLVALVDAPGLGRLRELVRARSAAAMGDETGPASNHDFMPHITLTYQADEAGDDLDRARELVGMPLTFADLELLFGDEPNVHPLVEQDADGEDDTDPVGGYEQEASEMTDTATAELGPMVARLTRGGVLVEFDQPVPLSSLGEVFADIVEGAETPGSLEQGDSVAIDDSDMIGVVAEVEVGGVVSDSQGNELEGTPEEPAYLIVLWEGSEPTDVSIVATAGQVTKIDDLAIGDDPNVEAAEGDEVEAEPDDLQDESIRAVLERRASEGDFDYEMLIIPEGTDAGDRRFIEENALTWRDLETGPLPLMVQVQNPETGGHALAYIAGSIWQIERRGTEIWGFGFFDSGQWGIEARRLITEGTIKGVSADIDMVESDMQSDKGDEPRIRLTSGRIMGATITPFPAFQEAIIRVLSVLTAGGELTYEMVLEAFASADTAAGDGVESRAVWRSVIPFQGGIIDADTPSMLTASPEGPVRRNSYPTEPPAEWFAKRTLNQRHAVEVDADGAVWGHVAGWFECHIGSGRACITPPRSRQGYRHGYEHWRRAGSTLLANGQTIRTSPIFLDLNHSHAAIPDDAAQEMEHTGLAVCDVTYYEDEWGIQVAGAVRPTASPEQVRVLRGSDVSPHWCNQDGNLELVGAMCVNVSGYPPPKVLVASAAGDPIELELDGSVQMVFNHHQGPEPTHIFGLGGFQRNPDPVVEMREDLDFLMGLLAPQRAAAAMSRIEAIKAARSPRPAQERVEAAMARMDAVRAGRA